MNIMIAGCGKVGKSIAMRLCDEGHQVTVIDIDEHALSAVTNSLDVMGYHGDCTSIRTLEEAGIKDTDLLITVTSDDEKNMLTCLIARKAGGCQTIARVRSPQYAEDIKYIKEDLGLSMSINPEKVAAEEMLRRLGNLYTRYCSTTLMKCRQQIFRQVLFRLLGIMKDLVRNRKIEIRRDQDL